MRPIAAGINAPPIMDMTSRDDPRFVRGPKFLRLSAKMVGNMLELQKPNITMDATGTTPEARIPNPTCAPPKKNGALMLLINCERAQIVCEPFLESPVPACVSSGATSGRWAE